MEKTEHSTTKNIKLAFFLNFGFTIIELIGGYLTNSIAIMSDALHDLGDSFSLAFAWGLENVSNKKHTENFTFGYKRFSLLGALINSIVLLIGSFYILTESLPRLQNPQFVNAEGMFYLSIFGIIINSIAVLKTRSGKSLNERTISLHLLEDVLGWIAVFVTSIIMMFTEAPILDPILSIVITVYILWGVYKNLKETLLVFLQASPSDVNIKNLENLILKVPEIENIYKTQVWSLDGEIHILNTHIVLRNTISVDQLKKVKFAVKTILSKNGIANSTIEIEFADEVCDLIQRD
jgi:cobalt-zinc-cadmium efflux system protein